MWDTHSVRPTELLRSSHIRLVALVYCIIVAAFLVAGWLAYRAVSADLYTRVQSNIKLSALELQNQLENGDVDAVALEIEARMNASEPDDVVLWLGTLDGETISGLPLDNSIAINTGDYLGNLIGRDADDLYYLNVITAGERRLIVGASYEESDAIIESIFGAFFLAILASAVCSGLIALFLAMRARGRIEQADRVLKAVAAGDLDLRIPVKQATDDVSMLTLKINSALDQLSATVSAIRQVSVDIAHDLRTPLNRLGIRLQALSDLVSDRAASSHLTDAIEETKHIGKTFDALLRISQIEAGARRSKFRVFPLLEVASTLFDAYQAVAEDQGQSLHLRIEHTDRSNLVFGDKDLLVQLFANLIENAIHYAGKNAQIDLTLGSNVAGPNLAVIDNGPGIPEGELARVTSRFYKLDASRQNRGNGLGLAMCSAIARLHYTELTLKTNSPGLTVVIQFPHYEKALQKQGEFK